MPPFDKAVIAAQESLPVLLRIEGPMIDRIDTATLFFANLLLAVLVATVIWGATALLMAALVGVPIMLGTIIRISMTAKA
jgi:hypothetical protein